MSSSAPVGTDNPKGHNAMHGKHMKYMLIGGAGPVSYTHLTLPTILLV